MGTPTPAPDELFHLCHSFTSGADRDTIAAALRDLNTATHRHINQQEHTAMSDYMENHRDRRIDAAAKAIAHVMGCPRSWADFRAEARAALNAADKVTEETQP